jgi:uncharacterized membrane protein YcaP (DUF421 family)
LLVVFVRALILYVIIVVAMRLMGKQQIGQLQPFELVLALLVADLAAVPMQDKSIPLVDGLMPILALLLTQVTISYLNMRSQKIREFVCGVPSVLIENGKILEKELRSNRYSVNDLLEQLRNKDIFNIGDVEWAILETNGQLSVIPKSQKRPVCPADLQIPTKYEGFSAILIIDGDVSHNALRKINLDEKWLETELRKFGVERTKDVFFAGLDSQGNLYWQLKDGAKLVDRPTLENTGAGGA